MDVLALDPEILFKPDGSPAERMARLGCVPTARGPSMVSSTSDGRWAFVAAGKENRVDKIDGDRRVVVASAPVAPAFTPSGLVSPDDRGLVTMLEVGPCANHVWFVGRLAYVTIGSPPCAPAGKAEREGKVVIIDCTTHRIVRELTGAALTGDPHAIRGEGRRVRVGHESGNRVTAIDTGRADDAVIGPAAGRAAAGATTPASCRGRWSWWRPWRPWSWRITPCAARPSGRSRPERGRRAGPAGGQPPRSP